MNLRDLINRIETIELSEGLRLKDIEAQVASEPNEQKRAQTLMTLAQTNKLPGLYDPVSGYFVSADPDMNRGEGGTSEPKPRISATGTEEMDALLAKRGLVPPKANTSTVFRKLNPFSSSNKDYDSGVQGGSQSAIARQNKEDEELKQLADLIPKYKALKDKLASLNGVNTDARTGQGIVPADQPLAESLMESFSYLFDDVTGAGRAAGEMLPKIWNKLPSVVRGGEKQAGKDFDILDRLPNQLSTELKTPPRPDITDVEWRTVPDNMKGGVASWLKANPGKSMAAAMLALAAGSQMRGGSKNANPAPAIPGDAKTSDATTGQAGVTAPGQAGVTAPTAPTTYQIKPGDNLSSIAKRNNVSVAELMAANPSITNPNKITAGASLTIPSASGKPTYDQGVGSKPDVKPADSSSDQAERDDAAKVDADEAKKKADIEATQKEIDDTKQQLAALIVDLEKSEDEDNIRQVKDLESQLDDLEEIKNSPAGKTAAMSDVDQQIAKDKQNPQNNPAAASLANAPGSKAATTPVAGGATTPVAGDKEGAAMNSKGEISYPGKGPNYKPEYDPQHTGNPLYKQEPASTTDYSLGKGAKLNAMKESDDELVRWLKIANIK